MNGTMLNRRGFLRAVAGVAAATTLPTAQAAKTEPGVYVMDAKKVRETSDRLMAEAKDPDDEIYRILRALEADHKANGRLRQMLRQDILSSL